MKLVMKVLPSIKLMAARGVQKGRTTERDEMDAHMNETPSSSKNDNTLILVD
jgi:hypothetical protein